MKMLWKSAAWTGIAGGLAIAGAATACAQTHVVHDSGQVVRALGVFEWTGDESKPTASRFVPVTLFIDGHLEDAGVYLARPVPFALERGTVFELEDAGQPEGTLELAFARHLQPQGDSPAMLSFDDGWLGFGQFKPASEPVLSAKAAKSGPISPIVASGGRRPSFNHQPAASTSSPASEKGEMSGTPTTASDSADSNRPTLTRKTATDGAASDSQTGSQTNSQAANQTAAKQTTADQSAADSTDAGRPTLTRHTDSSAGSDSQSSDTAGKTAQSDDPDRPTLHRPNGDSTASPNSGTDASSDSTATAGKTTGSGKASTNGGATDDEGRAQAEDPDRPTLRKRTTEQRQAARKEHDSSSVIASATSLNDDPDRPSLHRGKPAGALDADDLPALIGVPPGLHQQVGISDAARRPEHDFTRPWEDSAERIAVLTQMQGFAAERLLAYDRTAPGNAAPAATPGAAARSSVSQGSAAATTPAARRRAAALARAGGARTAKAPSGPDFTDESLKGYTLSYGGAATYVYTASVPAAAPHPAPTTLATHKTAPRASTISRASTTSSTPNLQPAPQQVAPPAATTGRTTLPKEYAADAASPLPSAHGTAEASAPTATPAVSPSAATPDGTRYVTVVAQREPSGELKVAMATVTDGAHLDRTPRYRLVDAVDAEASNRASLLFELRAQNSRQFALYRVIGAESQQLFATGSTP